MANRDPSLWWLNYDFLEGRGEVILSLVRVRDYWIMTTDQGVWKFSTDFDNRPVVQNVAHL